MPQTSMDLVRSGMCKGVSEADWQSLTCCCTEIRTIAARTPVSRAFEPLDRCLLVVEGFAIKYRCVPASDHRVLLGVSLPGDFIDLSCFPSGSPDYDVSTISDTTVAVVEHAELTVLFDRAPGTLLSLWTQMAVEASIQRHWALRTSGLRAMERVANFLCEMRDRLKLSGQETDRTFRLPLTQGDIGAVCGLNGVSVNRVLRDLREAGCCTVHSNVVTILNNAQLDRIGRYDAEFLTVGF